MKRTGIPLAALCVLLTGCGAVAAGPRASAPEARSSAAVATTAEVADLEEGADVAEPSSQATPTRKPGDFVVYRFTGSFRKAPLTLSQRVFAREGDTVVLDMTLTREGGAGNTRATSLRVRISEAASSRGDVVSVSRVEAGVETPAEIAAYEALMAEVALAADQNEEQLASEETTVEVAGSRVACTRTSYRVRVGKRQATLETLASDAFAWGDLGGEIKASDGTVLYRAEIVEHGRQAPGAPAAVAHVYEE